MKDVEKCLMGNQIQKIWNDAQTLKFLWMRKCDYKYACTNPTPSGEKISLIPQGDFLQNFQKF